MTYNCSACEVNWRPHHVDHGRCPMCGGKTIPSDEPASDDADLLYRIARAEADKRAIYANIDRYLVGLEQDREAA